MGFRNIIVPQANMKGLKKYDGTRIFGVSAINEMMELII
jgi:predicted ATP-dependent serine protease